MKERKKWLVLFLFATLLIFSGFMYYILFGNPFVSWNDNKLEKAMDDLSAETITLEEIIPFEWDEVYTFATYKSRAEIAETIGFDSPEIKETVSEFMTQLIFVKDDKIVSCICKYPDRAGFYINLWDARKGESTGSYLEYGDNILFSVEQKDGYKYLKAKERGATEIFVAHNLEGDELEVQVSNVQDIRTENHVDDMGSEWQCVVFSCYPGAKLTVVDAGEYENGQAQWGIERISEDKSYTWEESRIRLYNDMEPVFLTDDMQGIFHLEGMIYVLKFEYV